MAKEIIGLDIGSYSVKGVFLDAREGSFLAYETQKLERPTSDPDATAEQAVDEGATTQVREAPEEPEKAKAETPEPIDATQAWADALVAVVGRREIKEPRWIAAVPGGVSLTTTVDVPFADANKVKTILPNLMLDALPFNMSEVHFDFAIQPHADGHRAVVGLARRADIAETLETFAECGVDPSPLAIAELALGAALIARGFGKTEPTALIDLGHRFTRIVVVHNDEILLSRRVETAGHAITAALATKFDVPYDEAERIKHEYAAIVDAPTNEQMKTLSETVRFALQPVTRDLRRSFQGLYARQGVQVEKVYICGGTSLIKNLDRLISKVLGVSVRAFPHPDGGPESVLAWAVAQMKSNPYAALALNLRGGEFAFKGRSSYVRRQLFYLGVAAAVMISVIFVALYLQKLGYEARRDAMKAQLQEQTHKLFGEEITKKKDIKRRLAGEEGGSQGFIPQVSAYELMHDVTSAISADTKIDLRRFEIDVDRQLIQIMGETSDAQAVDGIVSDLEKLECIKEIKQDKLKVKSDGRADFELQISTDCS